MHEIDLSNYKVRTDLIVEEEGIIENKDVIKKEREYGDIKVLDIILKDDMKELGKKKGKYITINFSDVTDSKNRFKLENVLVQELRKILNELKIKMSAKCLVVGLGNSASTPDSLGPKVASSVLVTRYLFEIEGIKVEDGYRNVSSFVPGVMGSTGIEASDIILGIIEKIKPDFILVVDALASSSIDRVNKTIQITDTGIHPGSGVGNSRKELSLNTLGIPVIAIGIPTVVDAVTIVSDTINYIMKNYSYNVKHIDKASNKLKRVQDINYLDDVKELSKNEKEKLLGMIGNLNDEEIRQLIFEVLTPIGYNMMVTPKEVDFVIEKLSVMLRNSINKSLHDFNFQESENIKFI